MRICLKLTLAISLIGCSSVKTTYFSKNPDGCTWETKHFHGLPVTIKVPTHLEVRVVEQKHFDAISGIILMDDKRKIPFASRAVRYTIREKDQLVAVDFVKPLAGTAQVKTKLDDQYFVTIQNHIDDVSIATISTALANLSNTLLGKPAIPFTAAEALTEFPSITPPTATPEPALDASRLQTIESLVAVEVFDIRDCEIEAKIRHFLITHLHQCRGPCSRTPFLAETPDPKNVPNPKNGSK